MPTLKIAQVGQDCVACGSCVKICPRKAIAIPKGILSVIDDALCIGCGLCVKECPASVISLEVRR